MRNPLLLKQMNFSSRKIEQAVEEISRLPGIGKKTALRLALHLLRRPEGQTDALAAALVDLRQNTTFCSSCHTLSDTETCSICASPKRDSSIVCVVEDVRDVMAIENTGGYQGTYHVLGGLISPMDGVGPGGLNDRSFDSEAERWRRWRIGFCIKHNHGGRYHELLPLPKN
jgi:recombination protein RecR